MTDSTVFSISNRINIGKMIRTQFQIASYSGPFSKFESTLKLRVHIQLRNHITDFGSFTLRLTEDILLPINMF